MKGRQISDIHLNLLATLKHCKRTGTPAIISCYDYSKAFDMLDHSIIMNSLKHLKVKQTTIKWVQTLYKNICSKIQVNGALTAEIHILRGIRQGCPLSMLLFVIALEALSRTMKADNNIIEPYLGMKIQQYADDQTTVIADTLSDQLAQNQILKFCEISGLELNHDKTKKIHINLNTDEIAELKRNTPESQIYREIKILGIIFDCNELVPQKNWDKKIKLAGDALRLHWKRDMSILGKVKLINALALSHINYIAKINSRREDTLIN